MESSIARPLIRTFRPLSKRLLQSHQQARGRALSSSTTGSHSVQHAQSLTSTLSPRPLISYPNLCCASETRFAPRCSFSTTIARPAKAIINPKQDENGNDMTIEIMPRASNRLHSIAEKDSNPSLCLRVAVESGGCHGFQYLMSLTSVDKISQEEDTVFESEDGKGAKVVMDEPSLDLLKGSKIDYTMELIGSQFKVTGIPGAKSSCGCGTSFDIQA